MGFSIGGLAKTIGTAGLSNVGDAASSLAEGTQNPYWTPPQYSNAAGGQLTKYAQDPSLAGAAVRSNPLLSGLYGAGGTMEQAQQEAGELQHKGFSLTNQDHEAYGQASDSLARLFGGQEADLSQSLANRGLGAGASGAAGAAFTGLQGNKNEQLAKAQMQIADARMQNATQRLSQTRNYLAQAGAGANEAQKGVMTGLKDASDQYDQGYNLQAGYGLKSALNQQEQKSPSLYESFKAGLGGSAQSLGQLPGQMIGKVAGSGSGASGALGSAG